MPFFHLKITIDSLENSEVIDLNFTSNSHADGKTVNREIDFVGTVLLNGLHMFLL